MDRGDEVSSKQTRQHTSAPICTPTIESEPHGPGTVTCRIAFMLDELHFTIHDRFIPTERGNFGKTGRPPFMKPLSLEPERMDHGSHRQF